MNELSIALVGAGQIGRRHAELVTNSSRACLSAIVDVTPEASVFANQLGVPYFDTLTALFADHKPDGIILATPNSLHVAEALLCAQQGVCTLLEKPVADTVEAGEYLLRRLQETKTPVLVGHHRRYSSALQKARAYITDGHLGTLVTFIGSAQFYKPDAYFETGPWRKEIGGGPILINLVHEMDNLRFLCGEITTIQAMSSRAVRNFAVEDTVVLNLRFANGMLGTFTLSDTAVLPMSWEQTSGEDNVYAGPSTHGLTDCYYIAGTHGSLSVPSLRTWHYEGERSWWAELTTGQLDKDDVDPLATQLDHFCDVIENKSIPMVTPTDALASLRVVQAVQEAIRRKA